MTSTDRSDALPCLPTETHAHILSFCDASTLAHASLVSLAFLELASPVLYEYVTITGFDQLNKLFCNQERTSSAQHLDSFFSLDQTRNFTFTGLPGDAVHTSLSRTQNVTRNRSTNSFPIRVDTLTAHFHHPGQEYRSRTEGFISSFLCLFSPTHVVLTSSAATRTPALSRHLGIPFANAAWTTLHTFSLSNILWSGQLQRAAFFLQLPARSLQVEISVENLMMDLSLADLDDLTSLAHPQIREFVLHARSNEEQADHLGMCRSWWEVVLRREMQGVELQTELDRRGALIRYVIDDGR